LDEDWSEDALSAEEEVEEDRDLLDRISSAVSSITGAKGIISANDVKRAAAVGVNLEHELPEDEHEQHHLSSASSDVVMGILSPSARTGLPSERGGGEADELEPWTNAETHEGCQLFGYIDVSRAPGTVLFSPHAARHSFDFSSVNTTHHIDHLSFGLELTARQRARLPHSVLDQLLSLDGTTWVSNLQHETQEHHVNIMPTSFTRAASTVPIETYQFTVTSHARTRETLPSLLISYDVSPIHAHIREASESFTEFIVSLCAIIGGAVSVFGILDAMLFTTSNAVKKMGGGKSY